MPRGITALPDEFRKLLDLVEQGKLFGLQEWIAASNPLQFDEVMGSRRYLLERPFAPAFTVWSKCCCARAGGRPKIVRMPASSLAIAPATTSRSCSRNSALAGR